MLPKDRPVNAEEQASLPNKGGDGVQKPLQVVSGIVERRQTLPILANVLLRKDAEQVSFIATDLEIQIQTAAAIGAGRDAAATTVSARKLVDILRALPEADVALSLAGKKLTVQSGRSRFNLIDTPGFQRPSRVLQWLEQHARSAEQRQGAVERFVNDADCQLTSCTFRH